MFPRCDKGMLCLTCNHPATFPGHSGELHCNRILNFCAKNTACLTRSKLASAVAHCTTAARVACLSHHWRHTRPIRRHAGSITPTESSISIVSYT